MGPLSPQPGPHTGRAAGVGLPPGAAMTQLGTIQRHTRYRPRWSTYSSRPGMVGMYGLVAALLGCLPTVQLTLLAPDG